MVFWFGVNGLPYDGNSWNQTSTICRLFQSCLSNYSQQEKLEYSEYIFVTFTKFLLWVSLWYFGAWIRVAARAKCGRQTMRIQIRSHCYSSNLADYIKTQGLISTKLWLGIEQNVFSLCAKLWVCPLFEISSIDQPLFRGWGPPVRGGIVIWLARALRALGTRQHGIRLGALGEPGFCIFRSTEPPT